MDAPDDPTLLLRRISEGDAAAREELLRVLYDELRGAAGRVMKRERADHTLQPTALVHEAYMKLVDQTNVAFTDRNHFVSVAARAMRQVLVDHARGRNAKKRGGEQERVPLDEVVAVWEGANGSVDLVELDLALGRLAEEDEELARFVELRFFGGLTVNEVADVVGVSHRRVERGWTVARAWLHRELTKGGGADA